MVWWLFLVAYDTDYLSEKRRLNESRIRTEEKMLSYLFLPDEKKIKQPVKMEHVEKERPPVVKRKNGFPTEIFLIFWKYLFIICELLKSKMNNIFRK